MRFIRKFRDLLAALSLLALTPAFVAGPVLAQSVSGSGSSGGAFRYPTDSNDLVVWTLADATGTSPYYVNTGTTSGCNLDTKAGTASIGAPGSGAAIVQGTRGVVTDGSLYVDNAGNNGTTFAFDSSTCTTSVEPPSITIEVWIRPMVAFTNTGLYLFNKAYRPDGTFTSPYTAITLGMNQSGNGLLPFYNITVAGVQHVLNCQGGVFSQLIAAQWNHVGITFDGTSFITTCYVNGAVAGTQTLVGAIDYGTHGRWSLLSVIDGPDSLSPTYWNDARISNIARPASYFSAEWRAGLGLVP